MPRPRGRHALTNVEEDESLVHEIEEAVGERVADDAVAADLDV
jgi:hypothetical protein